MGKKYIIEIPDDKIGDFIGSTHFLMPYMMAGHIGHHDTGLPIEPYTEPDLDAIRKEAYEEGRKVGIKDGMCEAWEVARKVVGLETVNRRKVFGTEYMYSILEKNTATEAIEKIRQYEQEQEVIKVGDEVTAEHGGSIFTVTWMSDRCICGIDSDGRCYSYMLNEIDGKTGNHHEIAEVLAKMKETDNG